MRLASTFKPEPTHKLPNDHTAVDAYLALVPEPAHTTLQKIRSVIRSVAPPEATEYISYSMPAFYLNGPLIGYAAFTNHCSLFPMNSSTIEMFKEDLKSYKTSKGTIQFPSDKPLPATFIRKLVNVRVTQNALKKHH
jgi:uncharacterized protein YdhG (YjbR/CyaY superfamily)